MDKSVQTDWIDELYDVVMIIQNHTRQLDLRLRRLERVVRRELPDDSDEDEEVD